MARIFKYDVAISFAEEDVSIAEEIAKALKRKKISYYLYLENIALHWGKNLFKISYDIYTRHSKYVLLIISKSYIQKKWADIERQMVQAENDQGRGHILPMRIDDTQVDGLSNNIVFVEWNNNPNDIANLIEEKVRPTNWQRVKKVLRFLLPLLVVVGIAFFVSKQMNNEQVEPAKQEEPSEKSAIIQTDTTTKTKKKSVKQEEKPKEIISTGDHTLSKTNDTIIKEYSYCISISGTSKDLNDAVNAEVISLLNTRGKDVANDCKSSKNTINISLQENTTQSEEILSVISTSCYYTVSVINNKSGSVKSDRGNIKIPGFTRQANISKVPSEVIKKLNALL